MSNDFAIITTNNTGNWDQSWMQNHTSAPIPNYTPPPSTPYQQLQIPYAQADPRLEELEKKVDDIHKMMVDIKDLLELAAIQIICP